jgi:signal peptidase I
MEVQPQVDPQASPPEPPPSATQAPPPPESASAPKKTRRYGSTSVGIQSLLTTVVIAVFVITFVIQAFQIPSESMENTLLIGDYLLVDKVHFGHGGIWGHIEPYTRIRRGDIIVFRYPVNPVQHFVKRVIGIPGDRIRLVDKQVFVNGIPLREPYVIYKSRVHDSYRDDFPNPDRISYSVEAGWWLEMRKLVKNGELLVPPGEYFVLGDNRDESLDSRYWGFVPVENVIGRPLVIYWSVQKPERVDPVSTDTTGDKLWQFTYIVSHLFQDTRWDRTLRLVK